VLHNNAGGSTEQDDTAVNAPLDEFWRAMRAYLYHLPPVKPGWARAPLGNANEFGAGKQPYTKELPMNGNAPADARRGMSAYRAATNLLNGLAAALVAVCLIGLATPSAQAQARKPNILVIMGDDIGWFNVGAYHRGMMSGKTPNLDKLAAQGMLFTDYYAEASCTAGRANFITGELPIRTGMTTVGQPGADVGIPAEASTIATALKTMGYTTAQFGKNHLGDLNKFLPTVHGFDEYFGYLYHLDAMSDPFWYSYPTDPAIRDLVLPRNLTHSWATDTDDPTVQPRWGAIGKQKIVDEGPLAPGPNTGRTIYGGTKAPQVQITAKYDMTTFDEVLVQDTIDYMKKAKADGKPFFLWHNTTREHVWSFLSPQYKALMNP
jgi:arylsulfatase A-like enzyme